ncbi:MAG: TIGR03943 family protein [Actinomycetota bacterium]|nr:TIGR03943 family protein [Actinomycetota bacterium]
MRWSPRAVAGAAALAAWAGLFWFLMATGRTNLYLSSRTDWVVPVGAIILTISAAGRFVSARSETPHPLSPKDAWGIGVIILPVVAVLALPPASLSSFAASRRSSFATAGFSSSPEQVATGELSLSDVAGALRSEEAMTALVGRAGSDVDFTGFVTRDPGAAADEFTLTRFLISCCVADALSVEVRVVGAPPGEFEKDQWVRVTGKIYPLGDEVIVDARSVEAVERPEKPYLNP